MKPSSTRQNMLWQPGRGYIWNFEQSNNEISARDLAPRQIKKRGFLGKRGISCNTGFHVDIAVAFFSLIFSGIFLPKFIIQLSFWTSITFSQSSHLKKADKNIQLDIQSIFDGLQLLWRNAKISWSRHCHNGKSIKKTW